MATEPNDLPCDCESCCRDERKAAREIGKSGHDDELPPVYQPTIERTIQTTFHDAGEHKPMPFPEKTVQSGERVGFTFARDSCSLPLHGDVEELVRAIQYAYGPDDPEYKLADACERLAGENAKLRSALFGVKSRVVSQDGGPCFCTTLAMLYCVGQVKCKEARAALAPEPEKR